MDHDTHSIEGIEVLIETGLEVDHGNEAPELASYNNEKIATTQPFRITQLISKSKIRRSRKSKKILIIWIALGCIIFFAVGITIGAIVIPMITKKDSEQPAVTPEVKPSVSGTAITLPSTLQLSTMPKPTPSTLSTKTRAPTVTSVFPTMSQESTTTTTATVSIDTTQNLNVFVGSLGADPLTITSSNDISHPYLVDGMTLTRFSYAINRACIGQQDNCVMAAKGELSGQIEATDCFLQADQCRSILEAATATAFSEYTITAQPTS
ncbi:hypothetical protein GGR57DRAFT_514933 [Xylariaceae sp. FL1272]|nr:hypothetical protein GGR57DRAFT_514933 [Xylariaceae sp. FL1272]